MLHTNPPLSAHDATAAGVLIDAAFIVNVEAARQFHARTAPIGQALRWRRYWERQCSVKPEVKSERKRAAAVALHERLLAEVHALYALLDPLH
jgi:hypothetical protein